MISSNDLKLPYVYDSEKHAMMDKSPAVKFVGRLRVKILTILTTSK